MKEYPQKTLEGVLFVIGHDKSISKVAVKDDKVVGFCGAHCTADSVYVMVHYLVHPDARKKGVGAALWQSVQDAIPDGSNVCLYGYDAVLDRYRNTNVFGINITHTNPLIPVEKMAQ